MYLDMYDVEYHMMWNITSPRNPVCPDLKACGSYTHTRMHVCIHARTCACIHTEDMCVFMIRKIRAHSRYTQLNTADLNTHAYVCVYCSDRRRHSTLNPSKTQLHTQHIPNGITGEFDIMTCRDLGNGEVQYFRIRYD